MKAFKVKVVCIGGGYEEGGNGEVFNGAITPFKNLLRESGGNFHNWSSQF